MKWLESQGFVDPGLHLAIEPLRLDDGEQTSDDILAPTEMRELLAWYRESTKWRGTRAHALLEVVAHVGARRSGIVALDLDDWNREERTLTFRNRPDQGTRLKNAPNYSVSTRRTATLSEQPPLAFTFG